MIKKDKLLSASEKMRKDLKKWMPGVIAASIFLFVMLFFFHGVCLSRLIFGLPCPACGLTRAAHLLVAGDIAGSLHMHPLLLFIPAGMLLYTYEVYYAERKPVWSVRYLVALLAVFIVLYAVRMYFYFPHTDPMTLFQDSLLAKLVKVNHH